VDATLAKRSILKSKLDQDGDLPLLGVQLEPPHHPDWEALIAEGVPPTLVLGIERRLTGRR
jgi:hypothetical protein